MPTLLGLKQCPIFKETGDFAMTSPYGNRVNPVTKKTTFHYGIDGVRGNSRLATIVAFGDGVVLEVEKNIQGSDNSRPRGNYVMISHGEGYVTVYQHLAYGSIPPGVASGNSIRRGEVVGFMGSTGASTGAHIHFEVKRNQENLDPAPFLRGEKKFSGNGGTKTVTITIPVLVKGSKGESVRSLQQLLIAKGYPCGASGADGSFGPATDSALRKYQGAKGLAVDGSCGSATWSSLLK